MGKCQFLITKGKKKGFECGQYTTIEFDNKYYCGVHNKKHNDDNNKNKDKSEINNIDDPEINNEDESNFVINFNEDLDVIIDKSYKNKNKNNPINCDEIKQIKNCLHEIMDRLTNVEKQINRKSIIEEFEL